MFSDRLSENLLSFSDNIFIGGYVLTPNMEIETVVYDGAQYRRARYNELDGFDAGIGGYSYYLHPDDLTGFFARRGYKIAVISDRPEGPQRFYVFVATRSPRPA
jgi:hypothetical protein